jgi:hypothetical protein
MVTAVDVGVGTGLGQHDFRRHMEKSGGKARGAERAFFLRRELEEDGGVENEKECDGMDVPRRTGCRASGDMGVFQ